MQLVGRYSVFLLSDFSIYNESLDNEINFKNIEVNLFNISLEDKKKNI